MFSIALKMLLGDKAKYISLVAGLAFATLLMSQQGAIFMGLLERSTGPLQNVDQPDLWVADPYVRWVSETRNLSESDLQRVRSVPGVQWAEPFFNARASADLPSGNSRFVNIVGIDRTTLVGQPPVVTAGRLEDLRIPDAVFIEEASRARLEFPNIGDELKLNDRRAIVVGFCQAKSGFDSPAVIYTTFENATRFVPLGRNSMPYVLVKAKEGYTIDQVKQNIAAVPGLQAFTSKELYDLTVSFILVETGIGINFGITVFLGVVVGLAISAAVFYQFTMENARYYAVLKAMGVSNMRLIGMVLLQALWVGLIGFGLGIGATAIFTLQSRAPGTELSAFFPPWLLVSSFVGMLVCVVVASLLSIRSVLRLEPGIVFK
jgi:putative ABC transport system permease protein